MLAPVAVAVWQLSAEHVVWGVFARCKAVHANLAPVAALGVACLAITGLCGLVRYRRAVVEAEAAGAGFADAGRLHPDGRADDGRFELRLVHDRGEYG